MFNASFLCHCLSLKATNVSTSHPNSEQNKVQSFIMDSRYLHELFSFPALYGSEVKVSACNAGDLGSIPGLGRPWRRKWQPIPVFLPRESHGWSSLVGYTPWGRKESDTTERLHFHFHFLTSVSSLTTSPLLLHTQRPSVHFQNSQADL